MEGKNLVLTLQTTQRTKGALSLQFIAASSKTFEKGIETDIVLNINLSEKYIEHFKDFVPGESYNLNFIKVANDGKENI